MIKKIFYSLLSSLLVTVIMANTFLIANANGQMYVYTEPNGNEIHYYLDGDGYPYVIESGEKVYILLPLSHLVITDEELLDELNDSIGDDNNQTASNGTMLMTAEPTNYISLDLPTSSSLESNKYSKYYSFANYTAYQTSTFRVSPHHNFVRFRSKDVDKPLFGSKKISFVYRYYDLGLEDWLNIAVNNVDCTGSKGYRCQYLSTTRYVRYSLLIPTDVTAYTAVFWTTFSD